MAGAMRPLVIFIHGTFAPGAAWTREDSPLYQAIQQVFPESPVVPFGWSGKNSHLERLAAATQLGAHIRSLKRLSPDVRIFLVAHSHGGNVALYALRDPSLQMMVDGLVCLATPYIDIAPRLAVRAHTAAMGIFSFFCLLGLTVSVVQEQWGEFLEVIAGLSGFLLSAFAGIRIARCLRETAMPRMREILVALRPPHIMSVPLLSIRYRSDEAAWWLRTLTFLMGIPFFLGDIAVLILLLVMLAFLGVFLLAVLPFIRYLLTPLAELLMEHVVGPLLGVSLVLAAVSWVAILASTIVGLSRFWGFGRNLSGTYVLTKVSANISPSTRCSCTEVEGDAKEGLGRIDGKAGRKPWLVPRVVHSLAYQDPWAIGLIIDWIQERMAERDQRKFNLDSAAGLVSPLGS